MEVKRGYKQITGVGIIPEEWEILTLGELFEFKNGLNKEKSYFGHGTPIVNYMDVFGKRGLYAKDILGKVFVGKTEIKSYEVLMGDVFFTRTSETVDEVGLSSVILDGVEDTVFSGFILRARPKNDKLVTQYKKYCFSTKQVRQEITSKSSYTTRALTNGNLLSKVKIAIPPTKAEQTDIANALSDADALINNLEKLIAKKRGIKQGVMQELLTGKKRLPGFTGEWKVKKLGEVAEITKGSGLSKEKLDPSGNNGCILYGELFTTYKQVIEHVVSRTNSIEGRLSKYGDILMPGSTTTVGIDLAIASALLEDNVLLGGDIIILRKKDNSYNSEFLAHYLTQIKRHAIAELAQGITIIHMYGSNLINLELKLPSTIEEQDAIATILSDMEAEIETLEHKLTKYKLIKQGMMQELLTGKKRLI